MAAAKAPGVGDSFVCRHCGKESIAKLEKIMDGWTYMGDAIVCAFCNAAVSSPDNVPAAASPGSAAEHADGLERLSSLLNETPVETKRLVADDDARFCRDCVNFLRHPFVSRCLLHDKPVEPMDDCDDFERRPSDDDDGGNR